MLNMRATISPSPTLAGAAKGFTLLETMLALVIGVGILMLGLKVYSIIMRDTYMTQIKYNVDQIFGGAAQYYQANCRMQIDPATGDPVNAGTYGKLDPANNPTNPFPVTVASLQTAGYIDTPIYQNPYINNTGFGNGYVVQFNEYQANRAVRPKSSNDSVIIWTIQVAVEIKSARPNALAVVSMLGADCASTRTASTVTPCEQAGAPPSSGTIYAVWERLPSMAVPNADPNTWLTNARVAEFRQLYTNNNLDENTASTQNYLCGS